MKIQLSDHFTYSKLIRYALPSVIMTMFISLYGIMDGVFVSNFADKTSFAAISFILPFVFALNAFGYMVGTGGSALIAKTLGEQKRGKSKSVVFYAHYFHCNYRRSNVGSWFIDHTPCCNNDGGHRRFA